MGKIFENKDRKNDRLYQNNYKEASTGEDMLGRKVRLYDEVLFTRAAPGGVGIGKIMKILMKECNGHYARNPYYYTRYIKNKKYYYEYYIITLAGRETIKLESEIISK